MIAAASAAGADWNGSTAIFITWDEGEGGHYARGENCARGEHCATNTSDVSCHIVTLVISPSTKAGVRSGTRFNRYSLLGTAEQLLHLSKLGQATSSPTMIKTFNL
jgi:Phosphoesterase family